MTDGTDTARMPEEPNVSLIVAVRNEAEHIRRCLDSVTNQAYPTDRLEVIVVDGDSTDGTREAIAAAADGRPGWRVLHNPGRALIPGLNMGIETATGEYIGYVNGHTELPRDYVRRMVDVTRSRSSWSAGGSYQRVSAGPTQAALAAVMSHPLGVGDARHNYGTTAGPAETVFPGFWPRWVFDRIGMFDPRMTANEDNELSHRIRQAGGLVWYEPSVTVRYYPRSTLAGAFRQFLGYGIGKVAVFQVHPDAVRLRHLAPAGLVAFVSLGLVAAIIRPSVMPAYAGGIIAYTAATGVVSVRLSRGRPTMFLRTWAAFATVHAGYGVGTWRGLLDWIMNRFGRRGR